MAIHKLWRLSEGGANNFGLTCTDDGLMLGRTPLIERCGIRFVVRNRDEIERLLYRVFPNEAVDRLLPGLETVAAALNANDPCLARIAAVHLRIPDLPSVAARDDIEAEDLLIKYGDWDPALHPRTGTPPNPGWFASTDGSVNDSSPIRVVENDHPFSRTDAAESIGQRRVVLPPGERNDELADLLEWIANAKPEDEKALKAEIKRQYLDVGDTTGANALNAALDNVLGPGIEYKDRQRILDAIGPYSLAEQGDRTTEAAVDAGMLLLAMFPPIGEVEAAEVWALGWARRGWYFDALFRKGTVHPLARTIDDFDEAGIATSRKSMDLNAPTYQDFGRLTSGINRYLVKLEGYRGTNWGGDRIEPDEITGRMLHLIIPKDSMKAVQMDAIDAAIARAAAKGISIKITEF
jgi:CDI toxin restriction endonuclease-like domain